jgi:hypothetical protein
MGIKDYKEKLKNSSVQKTEEKILEDSKPAKKKNVGGRPKKKVEDVRNINIPTAYSKAEKEWIDAQAREMSKQLNIKITASAWIRSKVLADMPKEEEE